MQKKTTQKSIIFPIEIAELIQKIAKIEDRDFSYMINRIVKNHFNDVYDNKIHKHYSVEVLDIIISEWRQTKWQKK